MARRSEFVSWWDQMGPWIVSGIVILMLLFNIWITCNHYHDISRFEEVLREKRRGDVTVTIAKRSGRWIINFNKHEINPDQMKLFEK